MKRNFPAVFFILQMSLNPLHFHLIARCQAVTHQELKLISRWPDGPCLASFVQDQFAYVGNGGALDILDIFNPMRPVRIGRVLLPSHARGVHTAGSFVYVADRIGGLRIIDVAKPADPHEISSVDTGDLANDLFWSDSYVYLVDRDSGLHIINVSDPHHPCEVSVIGTHGWASSVCISGKYAYVAADWEGGMRIIDISTPESPCEVGFFDTKGNAYGISVSGTYAYVADWQEGLLIIDVSDPAKPKEAATFNTIFRVNSVFVSGEYAYVVDVDAGLYVIDIREPTSPKLQTRIETPYNSSDVYACGGYAYLSNGTGGFSILDAVSQFKEIGHYDTGGLFLDVQSHGRYVYLTDWGEGRLFILDINNPNEPEKIAFLQIAKRVDRLALENNYAYVCAQEDGLFVVDVSAPDPRIIGSINLGSRINDIVLSEKNYAYVAHSRLSIVDRSDPQHLYEISAKEISGANDIFLAGSYLYVSVEYGDMQIINVNSPPNPELIGSRSFSSDEGGGPIFVSNGFAFVANRFYGLRIIDVRQPASPRQIALFKIGTWLDDIFVERDIAYVADVEGLYVIDVSSPENPQELAYFSTAANKLFVTESYIFLTSSYEGLYIFENGFTTGVKDESDMSTPFKLYPNYPNPANPSTTIKYELPTTAHIQLTIYDMIGRQVKHLVHEQQPAGRHSIFWDGTNKLGESVAAGLYFCMMETDGFKDVIKLALVR